MHEYGWIRTGRMCSLGSRRLAKLGCLIAIVGVATSAKVAAASTYQGYVGNVVQALGSSGIYIQVTNGSFGTDSCNASTFWVFISNTASTLPATLAMALEAKATGNAVYVAGNGVCTSGAPNSGVSEALLTFYLD